MRVLLHALAALLAGCHIAIGPAVDDPELPGDQRALPDERQGLALRGEQIVMTESGSHVLHVRANASDLADPARCLVYLDGRHTARSSCEIRPPANESGEWLFEARVHTYAEREAVIVYDAEARMLGYWSRGH